VRASLLAAGQGLRLQFPPERQLPKCLLRFGSESLLERHWRLLRNAGVEEIVLAVGFRRELIEAELERLAWNPQRVVNERFDLGSMLTLHTVADALTRGGDVLVMDADVLYHERIMALLTDGERPVNRILIDREFDAGEEPVKVCVRAGVPVELRKKVAAGLQHDTIGESVGFFRFDESAARRLAQLVGRYIEESRPELPHEEAIRDLIQEGRHPFETSDVTGVPWIEIDFAADVMRAAHDVLPRLRLTTESLRSAPRVVSRRLAGTARGD
jgi:choline kinase